MPGRGVSTIGVVASAAGGLEALTDDLVQPLVDRGHNVAVTLTPTAYSWLEPADLYRLADVTGWPVRSLPRLPWQDSPHPRAEVLVAAPFTANSVAKLALGIADNQALTLLSESLTTVPMVLFPRINAAHARHPAWAGHLERLRAAGVDLVYGPDVWPLAEPRTAGPRQLPWQAIMRQIEATVRTTDQRI